MEGSKNIKKGSLHRRAFRDLPGGLVVRTPSFQRRQCGFKPWSGNLASADPTCHVVWHKNNNNKNQRLDMELIYKPNECDFLPKALKYSIRKLAWSLTQITSNISKKKSTEGPNLGSMTSVPKGWPNHGELNMIWEKVKRSWAGY